MNRKNHHISKEWNQIRSFFLLICFCLMLEVCHQQWEGFKQSAYYETVVTGYEELTYKGKSFLQSTGILFQFQEEKATHKVHDEHDTVGFTQRDHVFTGIISILNSL